MKLTHVLIPNSVTQISDNPFPHCQSLTAIQVSPAHAAFAIKDGVLFEKSLKSLICHPCGLKEHSCTIPQGTESIARHAFAGCGNLHGISIPDSVTFIGEGAFKSCINLTSVRIPDSVTAIEKDTFSCCENLSAVRFPDSLASIGPFSFFGCDQLSSVNIPTSVASIGERTFWGCTALASVTLPDSTDEIGEKAFEECPGLTLTFGLGSYAERYCMENGLKYVYNDADIKTKV